MSWIAVDIETVGLDLAREFIPAPDLNAITAPSNYKKPDVIAEFIAAKRIEVQAEYEASLSRAALDWNLSRIVAMGWQVPGGDVFSATCRDEQDERSGLEEFWRDCRGRKIVGFAARTFDVPTLIQRSRLLNVSYPRVRIDRFGRGDVMDVRDVLTFDDARYEALMPRSLKVFCKRFGIPCSDEIDGKDIAALVAAGEWAKVEAHVRSDVEITVALAKRVGAIPSKDWNRQEEQETEDVL